MPRIENYYSGAFRNSPTFTIRFKADLERAAKARGIPARDVASWKLAAEEAGRTFEEELGEFLEAHPFVSSFRITTG